MIVDLLPSGVGGLHRSGEVHVICVRIIDTVHVVAADDTDLGVECTAL